MRHTAKTVRKTVAVRVDAKAKKTLAKASAALSELAGAWIQAQTGGTAQRR